MPRPFPLLKVAAVAAAVLATTFGPHAVAGEATANDAAKILAGIAPPADSALAPLAEDGSWKAHARAFDGAWKRLDDAQLTKIRDWSAKNLGQTRPTLLYMFSGPDFLYANAFFPNASTYVMAGLEPVGKVPDLSKLPKGTLGRELRQLEGSLNSVLAYSFFITKKMRVQFSEGQVTGTLPILYVFLARAGKTIEQATYVNVTPNGKLESADEKTAKGVRITFADADGTTRRTLYYFSTDISNGPFSASGFEKFCESFGEADALLKSASFLMHGDNFSDVRGFLIRQSALVLQDDSGIPVRYFPSDWQMRPFGRYIGPIPLFAGKGQKQLYELFAKNKSQPLGFSYGYQWRPSDSNLMIAAKPSTVLPAQDQPAMPAQPGAKPIADDGPGRIEPKSVDDANAAKPVARKRGVRRAAVQEFKHPSPLER